MGAGVDLPTSGRVFFSIKDSDKTPQLLETAQIVTDLGMTICATKGTADWLEAQGIKTERVNKVYEGGRTVADLLKDGEIALVFNSTEGTAAVEDSRSIRAVALNDRIPYYTTLSGSHAAALAMKAKVQGDVKVRALQG
jgi:carbamoyl-phosphate synthase large subunit